MKNIVWIVTWRSFVHGQGVKAADAVEMFNCATFDNNTFDAALAFLNQKANAGFEATLERYDPLLNKRGFQ